MSYFSHHPEDYDEIIQKGITDWMTSYAGFDIKGYDEEARTYFSGFIANLQCDYDKPAREVLEWFMKVAHEEIVSAEQSYWERFYP